MDFRTKSTSVKATRVLVLLYLVILNPFCISAQTDSTSRNVTVGTIELSGNKKTRESIVYRELLIKSGGIYSSDEFSKRVNQSRLNLLNTSLFNFVTIDTLFYDNKPVFDEIIGSFVFKN